MSKILLKHAVKLHEERMFDEIVPSSTFKLKDGLNRVAHTISDLQFPKNISARVEIYGFNDTVELRWELDAMEASAIDSGFRQVTFTYEWDRETGRAMTRYLVDYERKLRNDGETSEDDIEINISNLEEALQVGTFYVVFDLTDKSIFGTLRP